MMFPVDLLGYAIDDTLNVINKAYRCRYCAHRLKSTPFELWVTGMIIETRVHTLGSLQVQISRATVL